jgi:hypothetical protein
MGWHDGTSDDACHARLQEKDGLAISNRRYNNSVARSSTVAGHRQEGTN